MNNKQPKVNPHRVFPTITTPQFVGRGGAGAAKRRMRRWSNRNKGGEGAATHAQKLQNQNTTTKCISQSRVTSFRSCVPPPALAALGDRLCNSLRGERVHNSHRAECTLGSHSGVSDNSKSNNNGSGSLSGHHTRLPQTESVQALPQDKRQSTPSPKMTCVCVSVCVAALAGHDSITKFLV